MVIHIPPNKFGGYSQKHLLWHRPNNFNRIPLSPIRLWASLENAAPGFPLLREWQLFYAIIIKSGFPFPRTILFDSGFKVNFPKFKILVKFHNWCYIFNSILPAIKPMKPGQNIFTAFTFCVVPLFGKSGSTSIKPVRRILVLELKNRWKIFYLFC